MDIGIYLLPAFLLVFSSSTFLISYTIAVAHNHTDAFLPYISDTATTPPEYCIFSLMTFITALAGVGTIYVRYKFIEAAGVCSLCNRIAFVVGLLSSLGMCIVATFQVRIIGSVHRIGAVMFFATGVVYMIMQTCISRKVNYDGYSTGMFCLHTLLATIASLAVIPMFACTVLLYCALDWRGKGIRHSHLFHLAKDYELHMTSVVLEWVAAFCFVLYYATYIREFQDCTITVKAELKRHGYQQLRDSHESQGTQ